MRSQATAPGNGNGQGSQPFQYNQQQQQQQAPSQGSRNEAPRRQKHSQTRSKSVVQQGTSISKNGKPLVHFMVGANKFTVHSKYKLLRAIGHGAYGIVCSAESTQTKEFVAIKKITNLFNNPVETKRAIREVQLLRKLRHENILGLIDLMMNDVKFQNTFHLQLCAPMIHYFSL